MMAISEREQRRRAMISMIFVVPGITIGGIPAFVFDESMLSLTKDWPGGPTGFTVTVSAVAALSILVVGFGCLLTAWPHRARSRVRNTGPLRVTCVVGGGTVSTVVNGLICAILAKVKMAGAETVCDSSELGCFLRSEHTDALITGAVVWVLLLLLGSIALNRAFV